MSFAAPKTLVVGSHVWFARNGATLSAPGSVIKVTGDVSSYTTVAKVAKPAAADTAFVKLGVVATTEIDPGNAQPIVIRAPSPGRLKRVKVIRPGAEPKWKVTCKEVQPLAFQLAFHTSWLDYTSTQFNPDEMSGEIEGWLKVQLYDQDDNLTATVDHWIEIVLGSPLTFDGSKESDAVYEIMPLFAQLNTGAL